MEPRLLFLILFCLIIGLLHVIAFWRRKAGEAAYAAARSASREDERDRYCRMAVMAGHKEACRMYCVMHSERFEDRLPLKPYKFKGMSVSFFGHYYPSRFADLLNNEQRRFCEELYSFKDGKNDGQKFFKVCMEAMKSGDKTYHVMFMPCSSHENSSADLNSSTSTSLHIFLTLLPDSVTSTFMDTGRACIRRKGMKTESYQETIA